MSVENFILDLVRADVARTAPADPAEATRRRHELAAAILQRAGIDPSGPEHQEVVRKADQAVRAAGRPVEAEQGGRRGAAWPNRSIRPPRPIVLDSSVPVAYERMQAADGALRRRGR